MRILASSDSDGIARTYKMKAAGEVLSGVVLGEGSIFSPTQTLFSDKALSEALVSQDAHHSLARQHYNPSSEEAVNGAINVAYAMSYIFHGMYTFFDRDDVGLENIAEYFKYRSGYEREEAESLMAYQNVRGGRVKLLSLQAPSSTEFDDPQKGDALNAFERALAMEKIQNDKYLALHTSASEVGDAEMEDYVKKNFLHPQVLKVRRTADFVSQLRRIGLGHGVWHFDQQLGEMGDDYGLSEIDPSRV